MISLILHIYIYIYIYINIRGLSKQGEIEKYDNDNKTNENKINNKEIENFFFLVNKIKNIRET